MGQLVTNAERLGLPATDERYTPAWVTTPAHRFAGGMLHLDVCTAPNNWIGARRFYSARGLRRTWLPPPGARRWVAWCNPPYSVGQVKRWADRAVDQAAKGAEILMLVQADISTGWFKLLRRSMTAVSFLERRVGFHCPDGSPMTGAKFGSAMFYFGPCLDAFLGTLAVDGFGWGVEGKDPVYGQQRALSGYGSRCPLVGAGGGGGGAPRTLGGASAGQPVYVAALPKAP